ncbi:alpha/beta hydrolase [Pseudoflavitalea sp. X16]|uniref:alpha/beta fold hydrolase n=1 Tax=Paraflavitalea devenefica TaxID=2716334 RepID=UPI00141F78A8|nr:alpha/beta hydrolase [Paraflavitalea devenefica]NII24917.1 alpha/beta hydrolase [Paraflavitalea devenefica]
MSKQVLSFIGLLLTGAGLFAQPAQNDIATPAVQSIQLSTGVNLQYVEQGNPSGTPVIFLHGFTDSWHSYELVLPHLPATLHAFALSQRGHGDAEKPLAGYDPKDFAADVAAFLEAKKIKAALVVGHSMGSIVAQRFAIDHPSKTMGIVLIGTFADFNSNETIQGFGQVLDTLNDPIEEKFAAEFQQSTLGNPIPPAFLQTMIQESLKVPARVWKSVADPLFKVNYVPLLKAYTKPVLIVWGDKDLFSPRQDQDVLANALSRSQLVVYTGIGHAVHWEAPARFTADLVIFARQLNHQSRNRYEK